MHPSPPRRVIILGSTGSIGTQAIDVLAGPGDGPGPAGFEIVGLSAGSNARLLAEQARRLGVRDVALAGLDQGELSGLRARTGPSSAEQLVRDVECDVVVAAIVGRAGLAATLAAVELGRDVALANKESLVAGGSLVVAAARRTGAAILPVDSEHSGVWRCLSPGGAPRPPIIAGPGVARVLLTASGGPFRDRSAHEVYHAPPDAALRHPTWSMGPKITIDSATLVNKALELVEAHWLFGLEPARLGVLIHPQSIVHALVEQSDGSILAQLAAPDMRTPIAWALSHPGRPDPRPGPAALSRLDFFEPDPARWPAIGLAMSVIAAGGSAGAILNGANEAAVSGYLAGRVPFGRITELAAEALDRIRPGPVRDLDDVLAADDEARRRVAEAIAR